MNKRFTCFLISIFLFSISIKSQTANFTASPLSGFAPLEVQFTNTSTGNISSFLWKFGDSTTTTMENPLHLFSKAGKYDVKLAVSGPDGSDTLIQKEYIIVNEQTGAKLDFSADPLGGFAPLEVQFTNTSTGTYTGFFWKFGDGGSSTDENPKHTYLSAGKYDVELQATGTNGGDTLRQTEYIVVHEPIGPKAEFKADSLTGFAPLQVQFTNLSTGEISEYYWEFGDSGTSAIENPFHVYSAAGSYSVRFIVTGSAGSDTLLKPDYIIVNELTELPLAKFHAFPVSGTAPLTVQFTDASEGTVIFYSWDFGDGSLSNEQNPTHTFISAGNYFVTLKVSGPNGADTVGASAEITVEAETGLAENDEIPDAYQLHQNYPNPFNPSTTIEYHLPEGGNVKMVLVNALGMEIIKLIDSYKSAGVHSFYFEPGSLISGIYFYRLEVNDFVKTKKMILMK